VGVLKSERKMGTTVVSSLKQNTAVRFDRVSSEDQRDGFSLTAQQTMGERYACENYLRVVKSWSVDESASKEDDRKHFFEMLDFVKSNNVTHVIFDKIDRACRGMKSAVLIEEIINDNNVRLHFVREHLIIDRNSPPQEKLRFSLGMILGKYYIDNLKTEINKGLQARREAGLWNSKAPFGYRNIRSGSSNRATVTPDEFTAPIVKELFQLYATGNYPYSELVGFVKAKLADRVVTKRLMETILTNPFYYGHMKAGGAIIPGTHEALVPKHLWDACQKIKSLRAANHQSNRKGVIEKALMGFMKCGSCGRSVTGGSHKKASGKIYIHYFCSNKNCEENRKATSEGEIFKQTEAAFEPFIQFSPEAIRLFIESIKGRLGELDFYMQRASEELLEKRRGIKEKILKLEQLHNDGFLSLEEFNEVVKIKETALVDNQIEITAHGDADIKTFKEGLRIIELMSKVHRFMHLDGNKLEKARLAKLVLLNPVLKDRTLQYHYEKPFNVLLKMTSNEKWWRRGELNPGPEVRGRKALHAYTII
jgi:site-specific DNA recombinase